MELEAGFRGQLNIFTTIRWGITKIGYFEGMARPPFKLVCKTR